MYNTTTTTFWYTNSNPVWLPQGFQIPPHLYQYRGNYIAQAQQAFWQFDTNRSGYLNKKEFKRGLIFMGVPKHQAKHLFRMMDRDRNGILTIDEFINAWLFIQAGGANYLGGMMPMNPMMNQPMMNQPNMMMNPPYGYQQPNVYPQNTYPPTYPPNTGTYPPNTYPPYGYQ
ncbi:hypothetical protein ABK040_006065 [Willaertia magna]